MYYQPMQNYTVGWGGRKLTTGFFLNVVAKRQRETNNI
jgi:hypothetical protein